MSKLPVEKKAVPVPVKPTDNAAVENRRERAESAEVLGRHRNSGPKDHKGAR